MQEQTVVNLAKCLRQISKTLGLVRVQRAPANDVSAALCAFAAAGARFRAFVALVRAIASRYGGSFDPNGFSIWVVEGGGERVCAV